MILAHVGGVPVEELLPLAVSGGALWVAELRRRLTRRRSPR